MSIIEFLQDLSFKGVKLKHHGEKLRIGGSQKVLTKDIIDQLKQHKAEILQILEEKPEVLNIYPLSYGQKAMWFLWQLAPKEATYNVASTCRICCSVNIITLQQTFQTLMARHPLLSSTFPKQGDKPMQQLYQTQKVNFEQINVSGLSEQEIEKRVIQAYKQPFDIENGPVMRVRLFTHSEEEHILLLTVHHVALDAWCLPLLMEEMIIIYPELLSGIQPSLTPLNSSYIDYVRWQKELLTSVQGEKLWHYWQQKLSGDLSILHLPTDRPRPPIQTYNGASYNLRLSEKLTAQIKQLAQKESVTSYMILLAAFQVLLHRYTRQEDILVGVPTAGRTQPEFVPLVGYFVDPMVMRADLSGNPSFTEFLTQIRQTVWEGLAHQDFPFALLVERSQSQRDPSRSPIFQAAFNFVLQNLRQFPYAQELLLGGEVNREGFRLKPYAMSQMEGQFDLDLMIAEGGDHLLGFLKYNTDLFDAQTITQIAIHFQTLLTEIIKDPQQKVSQISLLSTAERNQLLTIGQNSATKNQNHQFIDYVWGDNSPVYILDTYGEMLPLGVEGEIYIDVANSHINLAEKTDIEVLEHPLLGCVIKTQKWGRFRRDGKLEVLGLTHRQVWIKGYRINLQTIEQILLLIPGVEDCYILKRAGELIAYIVKSTSLSTEVIHTHLQAKLPNYMLPVAYIPVSILPLTSQGKIDEQVLTSLQVIDNQLIEEWQQQLNHIPEIQQAVVITNYTQNTVPASLHLSKLLPPEIKPTAMPLPIAETTNFIGTISTPESTQLNIPAISDGGILNIPEDAPKTLTAALIKTADTYKNQGITYISVTENPKFQTYSSLVDEAKCILTGLQNQGLKPGDKVILQIQSLRDYFPVFWGCLLGGIQPVTVAVAPTYIQKNAVINKLYNTWELLDHPYILASDSLISSLENWRSLQSLSEVKICSVKELKNYPASTELYDSRPEEVAFLQLTSGSTGIPKCIQETHQGIINHIHAAQQFNGYESQDICLNWLPMDHVVPLLTCHLKDTYLGCQQIEVETEIILANPLRWLDMIEEYHISHSWAPNFGFKLISQALSKTVSKTWNLSSIKFLMNAGEQVTPRVVREFLNAVASWGISAQIMQPAFGMAEVCTCMTYQNQFSEQTGIYRLKKSSVGGKLELATDSDVEIIEFTDLGVPVPGVQIRIVDHQNNILPEGVVGRFQIKGKVVTPGYLNNPQANSEAFVGDGWFNTGDMGFILKGHLVLTGREKELIIINGVNYYCYEIEDIVNSIDGVTPTYTAACAFSNSQLGTEGLAIFFTPQQLEPQLNIELIKTIRKDVTSQLGISPAYIIPIEKEQFPKTTSGKIQRSQLKQKLESGQFNLLIQKIDIQLNNNTIPHWFYEQIWYEKQANNNPILAISKTILTFTDNLGLGELVCQQLVAQNHLLIKVDIGDKFVQVNSQHYQLNPANQQDYQQLIKSLKNHDYTIDTILHLWNYESDNKEILNLQDLEVSQQKGLHSLLFLVKAIEQFYQQQNVQLLFVASDSQFILPTDAIAPEKATVLGWLKTIPQEIPGWQCRHIDLPVATVEINASHLLKEFYTLTKEPQVAYRKEQRLVTRLQKTDFKQSPQPLPFKHGGVYLITGGLGGIGVKIATYLLENYQARLLLIGRTPLPPENTWEAVLKHQNKLADKIRAYQHLKALPGAILYQAVDIANLTEMQQMFNLISCEWAKQFDGVIHLAGTLPEQLITSTTIESLTGALQQKVMGTWVLDHLMKNQPPGVFIHFSSVNSFFGGTSVAAYAAANSFLEAFSTYQRHYSAWQSYCLSWSMWDETGMSRGYAMKDLSRAKGYYAISPTQGIDSLLIALAHRYSHLFIGLDEHKSPIQKFMADCHSLTHLTAFFTSKISQLSLQTLPVGDRFGTATQCQLIQLEEMPLTVAGEIDQKQLTNSEQGWKVSEQTEPKNEIERQLTKIFQKVLGIEKIGINDNFFALGGHSILAAQIITQMRETFNSEFPLWMLFQSPSIAQLAEIIQKSDLTSTTTITVDTCSFDPCLVPIKPQGNKPPFFWIHPMAGVSFPYYPIAYLLDSDQPVYGLESVGLKGEKPPFKKVEDMAAYYINAMRSVQPEGPYFIAGWSLGAYIGFEMAVQLQQINQQVAGLVLLDTPASLIGSYKLSDICKLSTQLFKMMLKDVWPYIYDYLSLLTVTPSSSISQSGQNYHIKGLKYLLSLWGKSSPLLEFASHNPQLTDQQPAVKRLAQVLLANTQAILRYKPSFYHGKVILLKTTDILDEQDVTWGWRKVVKNDVKVYSVPGNHMTLLQPPHVQAIAEILTQELIPGDI